MDSDRLARHLQTIQTHLESALGSLAAATPPAPSAIAHSRDQLQAALSLLQTAQQSQRLQHSYTLALEHEVHHQKAQMQQAVEFESMLKRITDKVRDSLDESQILQTAVKELTLVLGLGGCNSALYDLNEGTSTIRYEYTDSIPTSQGKVAQMDHFPEIYRQLQQGYYFQFCSLFPNPVRGHVAMLACPIFVDPNSSQGINQAVLGDLWLIHDKSHEFSEFEIRLVQQVANQCAIAIRQARLYQAAQVQVKELEKLNRLKDEFLSTVSHELRTPIANVKMAIQMLKVSTIEERRQIYFNILESETVREAQLIDELLDLQRLESAAYPIQVQPIYLQTWLAAVIDPFSVRLTNHEQHLTLDCPSDLPELWSDPEILRQILSELLNNACKYTDKGAHIKLCIRPVRSPSDGDGNAQMQFEVQNQATILPDDLPHIFEKFYRVIQIDRYKQGGTGLGLALVQERVKQLGGSIQVTSRDGWTTFTVLLPNESNLQGIAPNRGNFKGGKPKGGKPESSKTGGGNLKGGNLKGSKPEDDNLKG
ncbi:MAG TPA: GAF domain-containing sensor histidine kinase [Chroococcidiopsis sp.]